MHAAKTCRSSQVAVSAPLEEICCARKLAAQNIRLVGCVTASTSRDGAEERVSYVSFPGSDALLHSQSKFVLAVARQKEGSDQGGGIDHRWGTRHRASPGQRVRQAGGQKGNLTALQATCCTHIAPSTEMHWLTAESYFASSLFWRGWNFSLCPNQQ